MRYSLIERVIHKMEKVEETEVKNKSKDYINGYMRALSLVKWFRDMVDEQFETEARDYFKITDKDIERNKGVYEKLSRNRNRHY